MSGSQGKSKMELVLVIAELLVTIVASVGVALYLGAKQDELQKQLVGLAQLELVPCSVSGCSSITIRNTSEIGVAKNVRTTLIPLLLHESLAATMDDISTLSITYEPPSRRIDLRYVSLATSSNVLPRNKNNTVEAFVESLPPKAEFSIRSAYSEPLETHHITRTVTLWTFLEGQPSAVQFGDTANPTVTAMAQSRSRNNMLDHALSVYVQRSYTLMLLGASATCDNCTGETARTGISVNHAQQWSWSPIGEDYDLDLSTGKWTYLWKGSLSVVYQTPMNSGHVPADAPLFLEARDLFLPGEAVEERPRPP